MTVDFVLNGVSYRQALPIVVAALDGVATVDGARTNSLQPWVPVDQYVFEPLEKVELEVGDGIFVLSENPRGTFGLWDACPSADVAITLARRLLQSAQIEIYSADDDLVLVRSMPQVPLANHAVVLVAQKSVIEALYGAVDIFEAAWQRTEDHGQRLLCTRASGETRAALFPGNWHLARHIKVEGTVYPVSLEPQTPEVRALVDAQSMHLEFVGADEAARIITLSADLGGDDHLSPQDVFAIQNAVNREAPDGRPPDAVRVVFVDETTARAEHRPVIDVGAEVWYSGPDGDVQLSA